jgi:hypothetical protein
MDFVRPPWFLLGLDGARTQSGNGDGGGNIGSIMTCSIRQWDWLRTSTALN